MAELTANALERAALQEFWQGCWPAPNRQTETDRNWSPIADFYAEDATCGSEAAA